MKNSLVFSAVFLFLAVAFGAFGAHGLEGKISEQALHTWHVGVTYQFYHGLGILVLGALGVALPSLKTLSPCRFFILGILLFSFNCYLYALTGVKIFALIIPAGGVSFLVGWIFVIKTFVKDLK